MVFVLVGAVTASAQAPDSVWLGRRVRMMIQCRGIADPFPTCHRAESRIEIIGKLESWNDSLVMVHEAGVRRADAIPRGAIVEQGVSIRQHGHAVTGFGLGTLFGIGITVAVARGSSDNYAGVAALVFALPGGMLIGTVVGAGTKTDDWNMIKVGAKSVAIAPEIGARRFGVAFSVRP